MIQSARKPRPKSDPVDPTEAAEPPEDYRQAEARAAGAETGHARPTTPSDEDEADYVIDSNGEVRAGPGDAGAQDKPRVLEEPAQRPPWWSSGLMIGGTLGVLILILLYFVAL